MASQEEPPRRSFLFSFGIDRLGLVALKAPYVSAAIIALVTLIAILGVSRMKVDDSLSELFRTDTKEFAQYEEIDRRFPSSEYDVLVVVEGPELLARGPLEAFRNVAVELQLTDGVAGIVSMLSARGKPDASGYAPPVVPDDFPQDDAAYEQVIEALRANDIVKGKFLSDDGTLALIVISLDRAMVTERGAKAVIGGIKDAVDQQLAGSGLTAKLTGAPVMQLEIRNAVERDRLVYNGLGFVVGVVIAYLFFRRLSLTIIAVLGPTIAILWTLGVIGGLDFRLNLFVNVITPLILVSGFSDSMHLVFAIRRDIMRGVDRITAARNAVLDVAPACLLTAMNAGLAVLSFQFADSALIRTFGTAALLAIAISYIAVAVVVPTLAALLIQKEDAPMKPDAADETGGVGVLQRTTDTIMGTAARNPVPFTLAAIVAAVAFGWAYSQLVPQYRLADQVPDKEQALAATGRLDQKLTGANPVHVMIAWRGDPDAKPACEKAKAAPAAGLETEDPALTVAPAEGPPLPPAGPLPDAPEAGEPAKAADIPPVTPLDPRAKSIGLYDVSTLSVIARAHEVLEKEAGLGNVWSLDSLRRWLSETGDSSIETIKSYVCILPEHLVRRFIAEDETAVLVTARLPDIDASEILPKVELIDRALEPVRQAHPGYEISVTGLPAIAARNSAKLIGDLNWGLVGDMFVIFIFLGIALRSILAGVTSILPSLLPIFATGALLWASGQGLQFASIIAITVAFSLAIDSTIHFINRFRLEEERLGGGPGSELEALKRTAHHIGPAVVLTTIVLAMGLGVTMLSHLPSLRLFGQLAAACLFVSLICQLVVLPATIALYRRYIPRSG